MTSEHSSLIDYQRRFIEFALDTQVLRFGEFTLKSGRTSPYFFNAGGFNTGGHLAALGEFYAAAALDSGLEFDMLFGPAYKGIPLAAATAVQLAQQHDRDVPWAFNRKEPKSHGEGGTFVGTAPWGRLLLIDDVITAGTAIGEITELLQGSDAHVCGALISIDRQERGSGHVSAIDQVKHDHGIDVHAIVTVDDIIEYMHTSGRHREYIDAMQSYRDRYGPSTASATA